VQEVVTPDESWIQLLVRVSTLYRGSVLARLILATQRVTRR
jgi:hypothetical protein